ncbi:TPA: hypothetical protein NKP66_004409 [Vibrio parahaemolyticus]|nr:hypothetical protein [Vibrio parahaemolyticus]HCH1153050.1 hypothetical protein [Vibrio parahaemolyticus]
MPVIYLGVAGLTLGFLTAKENQQISVAHCSDLSADYLDENGLICLEQ